MEGAGREGRGGRGEGKGEGGGEGEEEGVVLVLEQDMDPVLFAVQTHNWLRFKICHWV